MLKMNYEFNRVYRKGKYLHSKTLTLYYRPRGDQKNRLGITVSRKVRGSVKRNRLKRQLREIYRLNEHMIPDGWDIVLLGRLDPEQTDYAQMNGDYLRLINRAKLDRHE